MVSHYVLCVSFNVSVDLCVIFCFTVRIWVCIRAFLWSIGQYCRRVVARAHRKPPTYTPTVTSLTRLHLGLHLHCKNEIYFVSLSSMKFLRNSKNLTIQAQEEATHEKYPKVTNSREIDQIDHRKYTMAD